MTPPFVHGHDHVRHELVRACQAGRIPQVILLTGDRGVGKQTLGRWLAGMLLCTGSKGSEPCGACIACRQVANLAHPDFHWFVPIPRPKASDPARQLEEVRETLAEIMAARRDNPVYGAPDGLAMHGVASARLLLKTASLTTVAGGHRVILVGDADRLVPQEANQEAANALLKFLEEPSPGTVVILTTTDPSRVLPTIRSRAVPVRLGRLDPSIVASALEVLAPKLSADERASRAEQAEGSIGRALDAATDARASIEVEQLLAAARQGGGARFERVLKQGPWAARGDFSTLLDGLTASLSIAARSSAQGRQVDSPALRGVSPPIRLLDAIDRVELARQSALTNVNPQLLLATLTAELAEALWL